jgi:hypothetical protein
MKDQHKKIKGYRDLSQEEIDLMNEAKELAEKCGALVQRMRDVKTNDQRWISTGATDLQKGFMCIIRGVTQPTTF